LEGETMLFNINDHVYVKLTEKGHRVYRETFEKLSRFAGVAIEPEPLKTDAEGWTEFQMWELMRTFGPSITFGGEPPFETEIRIG
jgi:hypothetical protein